MDVKTVEVASSPFANPAKLPLKSIDELAASPVLVVAPHPDDETLGCGGAIALLRDRGIDVRVLVVSDGTKSHPNSRKYPAPVLKELRESESREAMGMLGVEDVRFLELPDGGVPVPDTPEAENAIDRARTLLKEIAPKLIFLPWRADPHPDHRATWQLMRRAIADLDSPPRAIEYAIWDWDETQRQELPAGHHFQVWRLDIQNAIDRKIEALSAYRSQLTDLIDDDPEGFRLLPEFLENFHRPWEMYLEDEYSPE